MLISATVRWASVGIVLGIIAGLALIFSILILLITKACHIKEDEKVVKILENLAGANCGGCGHTGCEGFAKCLAEGKGNLADCKATSDDAKAIIADILGQSFVGEEPTVAVVKCNGGVNAADKYTYVGNEGCQNKMIYHNGSKVCATACLGGGTCEKVCPTGAIKVTKDNVAKVDEEICTSCGVCIRSCPKNCIERIPAKAKVYVACSTHCKGKETMSFCSVGCIGCGLCSKKCPEGAITMVNFLPVIDYDKCKGCYVCVEKCPRHIIKKLK